MLKIDQATLSGSFTDANIRDTKAKSRLGMKELGIGTQNWVEELVSSARASQGEGWLQERAFHYVSFYYLSLVSFYFLYNNKCFELQCVLLVKYISYRPWTFQIILFRNVKGLHHRLIKITDRTLDVVFSRFRDFPFTITLRQEFRTGSVELKERERACAKLPWATASGLLQSKNP